MKKLLLSLFAILAMFVAANAQTGKVKQSSPKEKAAAAQVELAKRNEAKKKIVAELAKNPGASRKKVIPTTDADAANK